VQSERQATGLVLVPAAAALLGVSVAWAGAHDPLAPEQQAPPAATTATATAPAATQDPRVAALAAQIEAARVRVAELQATLAARAAQSAAAAGSAPGSAAAAAPGTSPARTAAAAPVPAPAPPPPAPPPAPAPAPAPPVDTTTGASG